jgi:hypothetical protein
MKYFYIIVVDALSMRLRPSIPTSPAQAAKRHTAAQLGRKDQRPVRTCASKPSRSRDPRPLLPRARSGPTCRTKHGNISAPPQGFRVRASHSLSLFSYKTLSQGSHPAPTKETSHPRATAGRRKLLYAGTASSFPVGCPRLRSIAGRCLTRGRSSIRHRGG